jgi:UDP-hydrolysing UDP-N-acetyl-D-glucosamine 2-epimerase
MKNIAIFTTSRADFGVLLPLIKKLNKIKNIKCFLFVGGSHFSKKRGETISEILKEKIKITDTYSSELIGSTNKEIITKEVESLKKLNSIFGKYQFKIVIILGDRYELLNIVLLSLIHNKLIVHISGGEKTLGAIDNQIRNMISKAAHYHFVACIEYKRNLIQMGERSNTIYNTGILNVENMHPIKNNKKISRFKIFSDLGLNTSIKTAIFTLHPETINTSKLSYFDQLMIVYKSLVKKNIQFILSGTNADPGHTDFEKFLKKINYKNFKYFPSLGYYNYLSLLKNVDFVIGNSSSGIGEAPFFKIPTINLGNRQQGRFKHKNIIDVNFEYKSIDRAIEKCLNKQFNDNISKMKFHFGSKKALFKMIKIIKNIKNLDFTKK